MRDLRARTSAGIVDFIRTSGVWNLEPEGRIEGITENLTPRHRRDTMFTRYFDYRRASFTHKVSKRTCSFLTVKGQAKITGLSSFGYTTSAQTNTSPCARVRLNAPIWMNLWSATARKILTFVNLLGQKTHQMDAGVPIHTKSCFSATRSAWTFSGSGMRASKA